MIEKPTRCGEALLTSALLMRPEDVTEAMAGRQRKGAGLEGWFLCGDVSAPMFAAIVKEPAARDLNVAAFTGDRAGNYVVFTQQLGMFQHRFLLPLFEPPVPEFLASLRMAPMQVAMGDAGEETAAVSAAHLPWEMIAPVEKLVQSVVDVDGEEVILGVPGIISKVCAIATLPALFGQPLVRDLSVSVMLPTHMLERVETSLHDEGTLH
jgi:hypothetical protein